MLLHFNNMASQPWTDVERTKILIYKLFSFAVEDSSSIRRGLPERWSRSNVNANEITRPTYCVCFWDHKEKYQFAFSIHFFCAFLCDLIGRTRPRQIFQFPPLTRVSNLWKKSIKSASNLFFYVPVWLFRFFSLDFDFDSLQITSKVWVDLDLMDHQTLSNLF